MRAVAGEHRVMGRAGTRLRKLHLGECLGHTSRRPMTPHATPGSDKHVPGKLSIFGIAGDRLSNGFQY